MSLEAFDILERLGVTPATDTNPRLHNVSEGERWYFDEEGYHEQAAAVLQALAPVVVNQLIPHLEQYDGTWHPDGFMVYSLGRYEELGSSLRFHVWPQGERVQESRGIGSLRNIYNGAYNQLFYGNEDIRDGSIHDHGVRITSLNLLGYQDNIYRGWLDSWSTSNEKFSIDLDETDLATKGLFHRYVVDYYQDGSVGLVTYGERYGLALYEHRQLARDDIHTISSDTFHTPTVPMDQLAATLVFHSSRIHTAEWLYDFQDKYPAVLMVGNPRKRPSIRPRVTEEQAIKAKLQLQDALAPPEGLWTPPTKLTIVH